MDIQTRIQDFSRLGQIFEIIAKNQPVPDFWNQPLKNQIELLKTEIKSAVLFNPWFTEANVIQAIGALGQVLKTDNLAKWISMYPESGLNAEKEVQIGVIMAGNIPLVGFHDFLCVLISNNKLIGKLSSDDSRILPVISNILCEINPEYQDKINLSTGKLSNFDAIIATGSNNTSRYFEYYFGKYPHIIRKSRQSAAILTGGETYADLKNLGSDMFSYFGLGCRNVSTLLIPVGFNIQNIFDPLNDYSNIADHYKYNNNYIYRKTIFEMTNTPFQDNGFCLFVNREQSVLATPIGVINLITCSDPGEIDVYLSNFSEDLQCVIGSEINNRTLIPFGKAQYPELWDYADGIDTMKFIIDLKKA